MNYREAIAAFRPDTPQEERDKQRILQFLASGENLLTRENERAHFTVSAWIVNAAFTRTLVAYHNLYDSWGWMGGHVEGETDFLEAAIREVREESGLAEVWPVTEAIFSLEVLDVAAHTKKGQQVPDHVHLNVTYLLMADEEAAVSHKPDENSAVAWMTLEESVRRSSEPPMQEVYRKLNEKVHKMYYFDL